SRWLPWSDPPSDTTWPVLGSLRDTRAQVVILAYTRPLPGQSFPGQRKRPRALCTACLPMGFPLLHPGTAPPLPDTGELCCIWILVLIGTEGRADLVLSLASLCRLLQLRDRHPSSPDTPQAFGTQFRDSDRC